MTYSDYVGIWAEGGPASAVSFGPIESDIANLNDFDDNELCKGTNQFHIWSRPTPTHIGGFTEHIVTCECGASATRIGGRRRGGRKSHGRRHTNDGYTNIKLSS